MTPVTERVGCFRKALKLDQSEVNTMSSSTQTPSQNQSFSRPRIRTREDLARIGSTRTRRPRRWPRPASESQRFPSASIGSEGAALPRAAAPVDALDEQPMDGWLIWVLFLLALFGAVWVALLVGF